MNAGQAQKYTPTRILQMYCTVSALGPERIRLSVCSHMPRLERLEQCRTEDSITPTGHVLKICKPIVKEYLLQCQNVICCSVRRSVLQHKTGAA